jgi:hypothetical protein
MLSFHAPYVCREHGVCCTSGWPIPIEARALDRSMQALASGRLRPVADVASPFRMPAHAPADTPAMVACTDRGCVFHHTGGVQRCGIQRTVGAEAMPQACRQFPRVAVRDPRGWSVTLSAVCPTAAALLEGDGRPAIECRDSPLVLAGFDATAGLPPALRPDMLMGWTEWWEWERRAVMCLYEAASAREAVDRLSAATEFVRHWSVGDGPLCARIDDAFAWPEPHPGRKPYDAAEAVDDLLACVPEEWQHTARHALVPAEDGTSDAVHRRTLMAHAFGNWTAHLGEGLRTWFRSIEAVHVLIENGVSVSNVDLVVRHLAEPAALARRWHHVEVD